MKCRLLLLFILLISVNTIYRKISKPNTKQNIAASETANNIDAEVQTNEIALQHFTDTTTSEIKVESAAPTQPTQSMPQSEAIQSDKYTDSQSEVESLHFTESMDEIIEQQERADAETDAETTQKQLEDLVYKYSSNEQRDELQNKLNEIDSAQF